ncbi:hypothetical protein IV102_37760 [bacterium]|nr:hypothetical protein [bacterium]
MSGNVEDEARARLDVAQLYEDMGQLPKAVRYYLEAAQIYKEAKVGARHRELCNKILRLDPGNAQAEAELNEAHAAAEMGAPAAAPAASADAAPAAAPVKAPPRPQTGNQLPPLQLPQPQPGKVLIPTPWLFRDPRYVQQAKKQLTTPLTRSQLAFDPLPKVDPQMVMIKQDQRKKAEEEAARKANPRVESAFSNRPSAFGSGAAKPAGQLGTSSSAAAASTPAPAAAPKIGLGGGRSGNQDLADQIRRRLQERGGK